jgi:iron complex outermembrane receptor protein
VSALRVVFFFGVVMNFKNVMYASACLLPLAAMAQEKYLGVVTVTSGQPTSLPTQIPTTMEGITKEQIEKSINATDSEDALRYFPSLLVRKRYIGDYNHAVLSSRASGTGNSARSAVYADGILLSNYLGNGATYAPRWGMVTPEEIERVDVMYGPFSAAYPGNSVGAIVDYVTRMPQTFEAHVQLGGSVQDFNTYQTKRDFAGSQGSASVGGRSGDWSWWLNGSHLNSQGQPMVFAWKARATAGVSTDATGGVDVAGTENQAGRVLGTSTQYHTLQDHGKLKLAYDISPTMRASYTLGLWQNDSLGSADTYLLTSTGAPLYYASKVKLDGNYYSMTGTEFLGSQDNWEHLMHGLSLKTHSQGQWDWEAATSLYDFQQSISRAQATRVANNANNDKAYNQNGAKVYPASITDMDGTGWMTLALKGTWRPQGAGGAHIVDFGYAQDVYKLRTLNSQVQLNGGSWLSSPQGTMTSDLGGQTGTQSLYAQDAWALAPGWKAVLGLRAESWKAANGYNKKNNFSSTDLITVTSTTSEGYVNRQETYYSPKAALSFQATPQWVLKASAGRAVRMPTVSELYGSTTAAAAASGQIFLNEPHLKPERSKTIELSAEKDLGNGILRISLFTETVRDAIFSQVKIDSLNSSATTKRVTNVGRMRTDGVEIYAMGSDAWLKGLDLSGSLTYANSRIKENAGYDYSSNTSTSFNTLNKFQPRVPMWRASGLALYRWNEQLSTSLGARYSGKQYSQLGNYDVNGFTYTGVSKYFTVDTRMHYQFDKQRSGAVGIDNLNNYKYWNFHLYPGRTLLAELKWTH